MAVGHYALDTPDQILQLAPLPFPFELNGCQRDKHCSDYGNFFRNSLFCLIESFSFDGYFPSLTLPLNLMLDMRPVLARLMGWVFFNPILIHFMEVQFLPILLFFSVVGFVPSDD